MHAEFFLARMKAQLEEGSGRILLGDNTEDRVVTLRPSGSNVLEFGFQLDYSWPHVHSILTCIEPSRKLGKVCNFKLLVGGCGHAIS